MTRRAAAFLVVLGLTVVGCKKEQPATTITMPGMSIQSGPNGATITAPGMNIQSGPDGANVTAPGITIQSR